MGFMEMVTELLFHITSNCFVFPDTVYVLCVTALTTIKLTYLWRRDGASIDYICFIGWWKIKLTSHLSTLLFSWSRACVGQSGAGNVGCLSWLVWLCSWVYVVYVRLSPLHKLSKWLGKAFACRWSKLADHTSIEARKIDQRSSVMNGLDRKLLSIWT